MRKKQVSIDDLSMWKPDKPNSKWRSRVSRFIYSPLIMLILGLVIGAYKDYFMTSKVITQDLRANILSFEPHEGKLNMSLTLVNAGNRPSTLSHLQPVFPLKISGGTPYLSSPTITVQGIPAVLNPGETRIVTIKGTLPLDWMFEVGSPEGDAQENIRTAAIALHFRSHKFTKERYEGILKVGEISVNSERAVGWGNLSYSSPLFDERYSSEQGIWLPIPRGSQEAF